MEFIEETDLRTLAQQRGALPEAQVLDWARQILDALEYLHTQQPPIIHRDIKPQNIIITPPGRAMVVDFGIAKTYVTGQITTTGARGITPGFSPPEQYGGGTDPRSDIYALGATLYFALTSIVPPESPVMLMGQMTLVSPRQQVPTISLNTEAVIMRAMQPMPVNRFQSAREMRLALTTVAYSMPQPTVPVPYVAAPTRQSSWMFAAIGGFVATLLLLGTFAVVLFGGILTPTPTPAQGAASITTWTNTPAVATSANIPRTATWTLTPLPPTLSPTRTATPTTTPTFTATPMPVSLQVFLDDFDGNAIDSSKWNVISRAGRFLLNGSVLTLSSSGTNYPFITSRVNPFPTSGNYRMTMRYRYSRVDVCGVGILMTSYTLSAGMTQDDAARYQRSNEDSGMAAGVWQDIKEGLHILFRSRGDRVDVPFPGPDTNWHTQVIEYANGRYTIWLDDSVAYVSQPTPYRARFMWIGNPVELGAGFNCPWDTLDVEYVRVESLP